MKQTDPVEKPAHYNFMDNDDVYEVWKVLEAWGLIKNTYLWNTVKYIARCMHKGNTLQDLEKARWYLNREISRLELLHKQNKT